MKLSYEILDYIRDGYGEAFYLLDTQQFADNYKELYNAFSEIYPKFNIAYSYKTNYSPELCKIVNEHGGYAEVVSEMELELAERLGVQPSKIIWNGPIKNPDRLLQFLLSGGTANIDSLEEMKLIEEFAAKNPSCNLNVGIRCNFNVNDGVVSRFGFDIDGEDFNTVLNFTTSTQNVKLISLQCHFAKRNVKYWPARAKGMLDLLDRIGFVPERIDLGGGLFGKMADSLKFQFSDDIPGYEVYANAVATQFAERFSACTNPPELIIEPGSALVGDCMKFVCTVKTIKQVRTKSFASVLGSQKNISMSGVNPPIEVYHGSHSSPVYHDLDIVGFTCIEGDVLFHGYNGPLEHGDFIVISNCGSYSLVMKPPFILPNFPVLDICAGNIKLIKRKETFDDIFHTFGI